MNYLSALARMFRERYGQSARFFSAPGRVNLIGEHTDYNDGFALPIAVDKRTTVAAARNDLDLIRAYSINFDEEAEIDISREYQPSRSHWISYVEGIARVLGGRGFDIGGTDLVISSNVPIGSGLASSAALELAIALALVSLQSGSSAPRQERVDYHKGPDLLAVAQAAQEAEHTFAGTKCGLMDQLASAFGKAEQALLIDCRSLEIRPIALTLKDYSIVICDSGVKHELATSAYNDRRSECQQAVEILQKEFPWVQALRDLSIHQLDLYQSLLPSTLFIRARHVVTENYRTLSAAEALNAGDLNKVGLLMYDSHESLRKDFEVSCPELDLLFRLAREQEGVAGARMTGAGFGGCTVNLVQRDSTDAFVSYVTKGYSSQIGLEPAIYSVQSDGGVREERRAL